MYEIGGGGLIKSVAAGCVELLSSAIVTQKQPQPERTKSVWLWLSHKTVFTETSILAVLFHHFLFYSLISKFMSDYSLDK